MAAPRNADIRRKILKTTTRLLQKNSFAEISLANIAKEAGISKGTLYYYYNNKEDILFDITDRYLDQLARRLRQWVTDESKDTSYKRFLRYVLQNGVYDKSGNLRLFLVTAAISGNNELRARLARKYNEFCDMIAKLVAERRPELDARHISWMLLSMMDGLLIQSQLKNEALDVDAFIETMVTMMDET